MPKLAANLSWMFQEWPFLDRFAAAADAGFGQVKITEVDSDRFDNNHYVARE